MGLDIDAALFSIKNRSITWDQWLMVADALEEAGRLPEAELMRGDQRVMIAQVRTLLPVEHWGHMRFQVQALTEEDRIMGRGYEPTPH